ncbi:precorrin-3B synthase [Caballeronia sp. BR00000012568055]|uniref:precorrin-3B synthase n=1 Tax=Caballeronia sp. BR00000012568055 TaxID=2918761 RepID=UPI0023F90B21|nr:precorrin-3B synthase [Caballeronia sp. BR00000012568055]
MLLTSSAPSSPVTTSRPSACPGLMRIVPARDGGLARLRLVGGEMSAQQARAVARAARECGSGVIEVTNRANLQLRGISDDAHAHLIQLAFDAGLGPAHVNGDDLRNLMLSPLASDTTRALAFCILDALQRDIALQALSPKFALQLDSGERLAMLDHPQDLWLSSLDDGARYAFGFAGSMPHRADDSPAAGVIDSADIVPFVVAVLHAFLRFALPEEKRMRDVLGRIGTTSFVEALAFSITLAPEWRRAPVDASLRLGAHDGYVGAQLPLGRIDAATLEALASLFDRIIVTPWQSVLIPSGSEDTLARLNALGLATDPHAPFARIIACAGSSGCIKSHADTKADAERLAALLPDNCEVHLTGCERSCAAARPVETTLLTVAPGRYDLYQHARLEARALTIEEAAARLARSHADA